MRDLSSFTAPRWGRPWSFPAIFGRCSCSPNQQIFLSLVSTDCLQTVFDLGSDSALSSPVTRPSRSSRVVLAFTLGCSRAFHLILSRSLCVLLAFSCVGLALAHARLMNHEELSPVLQASKKNRLMSILLKYFT